MANFVYVVGDPATREAVVIDPAWDVGRILKAAARGGFRITDILLTHGHPDHVNGVLELYERTKARVRIHPSEISWLGDVRPPVVPVEEGDTFAIGSLTVSVLHTPGHSPGSQCYRIGGHLFSGDTLFVGACGRTDLAGGDADRLFESLSRLKGLDGSLRLCPGHDYGERRDSSLGEEKETNPFLRAASLPEFRRLFQAPVY